jgi:hypothetical protein
MVKLSLNFAKFCLKFIKIFLFVFYVSSTQFFPRIVVWVMSVSKESSFDVVYEIC